MVSELSWANPHPFGPSFSSYHLPTSFNISSLFSVPMDRTNYLSWKSQFEDILEMHGLTAVINNNTEPPKMQEDGSVHPEFAKDKLVLSWIKATSSSSIKTLLIPCTTANQALIMPNHWLIRSYNLVPQWMTMNSSAMSWTDWVSNTRNWPPHFTCTLDHRCGYGCWQSTQRTQSHGQRTQLHGQRSQLQFQVTQS